MGYEMMGNNTLTLTGKIVSEPIFSHEVFGEGFYETQMSVTRLSDQVDILPITISERLLGEYDVKVGDVISVEGQFRSYNKLEGEKSRLMLTVFVREIIDNQSESEYNNPNQIEITGYICKQPIYRTTPFKREICDVLLAVNRAYNKSDYIPCILWGRNARYIRNMPIGAKITVNGRVQSRNYQKITDTGECVERTAYEVSVSKVMCDFAESNTADFVDEAN